MSSPTSNKSSKNPSETKSLERAPRWDENWVLIRRLWPNWDPTDEQISEVWFRSFDKPHGISGEGRVNQSALHDAIVACNRSSKWKEPRFLEVADAYRREKNRILAEMDRARMTQDKERDRIIVEREHKARVGRIEKWPLERLKVAMELIGKRFPTLANKSMTPSSWSPTFSGLVVAADEEIANGLKS